MENQVPLAKEVKNGAKLELTGTLTCTIPTPQAVKDAVEDPNKPMFISKIDNKRHRVLLSSVQPVLGEKRKRDALEPEGGSPAVIAGFATGKATTVRADNATIKKLAVQAVHASGLDPEHASSIVSSLNVAQGNALGAMRAAGQQGQGGGPFVGVANEGLVFSEAQHGAAVTASARLRLECSAAIRAAGQATPAWYGQGGTPDIPANPTHDSAPPAPSLLPDPSARQLYNSIRLRPGTPLPDWPTTLPIDDPLPGFATLLAQDPKVAGALSFFRKERPNLPTNLLSTNEKECLNNTEEIAILLDLFALKKNRIRESVSPTAFANFGRNFLLRDGNGQLRSWNASLALDKEEVGLGTMMECIQGSVDLINTLLHKRNKGLQDYSNELAQHAICSQSLAGRCQSEGAFWHYERLRLEPKRAETLVGHPTREETVELQRLVRSFPRSMAQLTDQTPKGFLPGCGDPREANCSHALALLQSPTSPQGACSQSGCLGTLAACESVVVGTGKKILICPIQDPNGTPEPFRLQIEWQPVEEGLGQVNESTSEVWKNGDNLLFHLKCAVLKQSTLDPKTNRPVEVMVTLLRYDESTGPKSDPIPVYYCLSAVNGGQAKRLSLQQTAALLRAGSYTCCAAVFWREPGLDDLRDGESEKLAVHGSEWAEEHMMGPLGQGLSAEAMLFVAHRRPTQGHPENTCIIKAQNAVKPATWHELSILRTLQQVQGVVRLLASDDDNGAFLYRRPGHLTFLAFRLEKMDGSGDDLINNHGALNPREWRCCAKQSAMALRDMKELLVCHGDIKPTNLLYKYLAAENGAGGHCGGACADPDKTYQPCGSSILIKVTDFEFASSSIRRGDLLLGTWPRYVSPEICFSNPFPPGPDEAINVAALDVFALGHTLAEFLLRIHGIRVFANDRDKKIGVWAHGAEPILRDPFAGQLISRMLEADPEKRISMEKVVEKLHKEADLDALPHESPV